ncbi:hypothetical protein RUM43_003633 [Polyplax serrata]|uniref:Uncharacterized protein n=1 Tax=Polyplax serrata TaxID=468196 RepID=A0AAN8RXD3_POLSC
MIKKKSSKNLIVMQCAGKPSTEIHITSYLVVSAVVEADDEDRGNKILRWRQRTSKRDKFFFRDGSRVVDDEDEDNGEDGDNDGDDEGEEKEI